MIFREVLAKTVELTFIRGVPKKLLSHPLILSHLMIITNGAPITSKSFHSFRRLLGNHQPATGSKQDKT